MKPTKKFTSFLASLIFLTTLAATPVHSQESCVDNGGCGYDECCRTSSLAPAIALGLIAAVGIVAVAVQNTSGHSHCSHE